MKKILISLVLMSFSVAIAFAQVPEKAQTSFKSKYPDATAVAWSTNDDHSYSALYTAKNGDQNVVVFNDDGKIIRTETIIVSNDYPKTLSEYYMKKYPDEKNYHVWVVTDENGNKTANYTRQPGIRIYFDKAGNYLREEKEKMKNEMNEELNEPK